MQLLHTLQRLRVIATIRNEGFEAVIREDEKKRVFFTGDADIDADGANGQNGKIAAYMVGNRGSEWLGNGGMKISGGRVVGASSWFREIVICGSDGQPREFPGGIIASKTAYKLPGKADNDPSAYLDSETVPYIVTPPEITAATAGVVKGCLASATYRGKRIEGVVGDIGPRRKVGEVSIAMARMLGMRSSPRNGGIDTPEVLFELWPGVAGLVGGKEIALMRANGTYV